MIINVKIILSLTAVLMVSILLFACGGGSNTGGDSDTADPTIQNSTLVIGDSISTGFNLATPWPNRLADLLNVPVNNSFSADGVLTDYGLGVIDNAITTTNPSHVVIFFGTNDAIRGSVSDAIINLQQMINIANMQDVTVIIATLPVITRSQSENARAEEISSAIRGFSGARVADVAFALGDGAGLLVDGVHPNNTGQQIIAETISSVY